MPNLAFQMMSAIIVLEELFPKGLDDLAAEFGIKQGQTVVDYGCGPGRYTTRFAGWRCVGKVYAVDVQELTIEYVKRKMKSQGLENIIPALRRPDERLTNRPELFFRPLFLNSHSISFRSPKNLPLTPSSSELLASHAAVSARSRSFDRISVANCATAMQVLLHRRPLLAISASRKL